MNTPSQSVAVPTTIAQACALTSEAIRLKDNAERYRAIQLALYRYLEHHPQIHPLSRSCVVHVPGLHGKAEYAESDTALLTLLDEHETNPVIIQYPHLFLSAESPESEAEQDTLAGGAK